LTEKLLYQIYNEIVSYATKNLINCKKMPVDEEAGSI
jgi:hypothetical protein